MEIDSRSIDVCVVCALAEEATAFLAVARQQGKGRVEEHRSSRFRYSSRLIFLQNDGGEPLTLHLSWPPHYGPQEMVLHLSQVLEEYEPCLMMMTGLCAGDPEKVHLGDLVVAERLFTYDNGKASLDEQGRQVYEHDTMIYQLPAHILQSLRLFDSWLPRVRRLKRPTFPLEQGPRSAGVSCHIKAMASGSAVRADHPFKEVRVPVRGTVAIDMEGAAFGLVMSRHPLLPWLVVKGVCDYADQEKNDLYHEYAARASALYALSFIQAYVTRKEVLAEIVSVSPDRTTPDGLHRARMLQGLQRTYHELQRQSLEGTSWIELGFEQKPRAVLTSTEILLRCSDQPESNPPSDKTIWQVYTEAQGELLILGQPGAGKSTLLLSLALELVKQAQKDTMLPVPVILPLISWAAKRESIQEWSKTQIDHSYGIPSYWYEPLMQDDQIILLLDGLDEMDKEAIPACIDAINVYHHGHMTPLVVSSRQTEYLDASKNKRLFLHQAIIVQPLTVEQVDQHLAQVGAPLAALRMALKANSDLQELATTPLMLNILMLTYHGTPVRDLAKQGKALQQQVFDHYVQRMVKHKGDRERYPMASTCRRLSWLARQLQQHKQKIFYPERLQYDWLPAKQQRRYIQLAVQLPGALIGVLAGLLPASLLLTNNPGLMLQYSILSGFLGAVFSLAQKDASSSGIQHHHRKLSEHFTPDRFAGSALLAFVWGISFMSNLHASDPSASWLLQGRASAISGLAIGLSGLFLMILFPQPVSISDQRKSRWTDLQRVSQRWLRLLLAAGLFGSGIWLSDAFSYALSNGLNGALYYGLSNGLSTAFNYAFLSILVSVILRKLTSDIHLTERLRWTGKSLQQSLFNVKHILNTLVFVLVSMMVFGLAQGLGPWLNQGLDQGLSWGLSWGSSQGLGWGLGCGLICWLVFGLFNGILQEQIEEQQPRQFNQGIRDSLRNSMRMSAISVLFILPFCVFSWGLSYALSYGLTYGGGLNYTLIYALYYGFFSGLQQGLSYAWLFTLSGSLLIGITLSGGLAVLRHYILRYLLQRTDMFPRKAHPFLEDAGQRGLLRCIGGKYSFIHILLQEYFADQLISLPEKESQ